MRKVGRRTVVQGVIGCGLVLPLRGRLQAQSDVTSKPPQENDRLVFALGSHRGELVTPDDVELGKIQVFAYPMDPESETVRDGTRLNQIILVRLDPADLDEETVTRAADGIVAFSGICSHTGCDVSDWFNDTRTLFCPCHESEFDPARSAKVTSGPAPRRLAALPLKIVNGTLLAAGSFIGRVGAAGQ